MKNTYSTSDVAKLIGIHPNTVRLYEDLGLITRPERKERRLPDLYGLPSDPVPDCRLAFQVEVLQNGLRTQAAAIAKTCASGDIDGALPKPTVISDKSEKKARMRRPPYRSPDRLYPVRLILPIPAPYQKTVCRLLTHYRGYAEKLGAQRASGGKENAGRPPRLHLPGSGTADYHQVSAAAPTTPLPLSCACFMRCPSIRRPASGTSSILPGPMMTF